MRRRYLALAVVLLAPLAIVATGCSGSPAAPRYSLADCDGHPQVMPSVVAVDCLGGSMVVRGLKWSDWGAPVATATGTATIDTCAFSDCVDAIDVNYPVVLVASGGRRCSNAGPFYAQIQYLFVGQFSAWPVSARLQVVPRPCS